MTGLVAVTVNGTTNSIFVSERFRPRIRKIDLQTGIVTVLLRLTPDQGVFSFRDMLRKDSDKFLLISRYGMVEVGLNNNTALSLFGGPL